MIIEDYVSFEIAKLLKEKGFDEPCHALYHDGEDKIFFGLDVDSYRNTILNKNYYACPTLQMAMKWLREVHRLHISIEMGFDVDSQQHFFFVSFLCKFSNKVGEYQTPFEESEFTSYEDACEAVIKYCLENLI